MSETKRSVTRERLQYYTNKLKTFINREVDGKLQEAKDSGEFTVGMVDGRIAQLSLSTDGSNIILSQNGVELTSVAIADINDIVFAEAFNVTSPLTLTLTVGDTSQITYTVSPSDSTQNARFRSNNLTVVTVNSNGLITALDMGSATVNAICGRFTATITIRVRKIAQPVWCVGSYLGENADTGTFMVTRGDTRFVCFPAANNAIELNTGDSISVSMTEGYLQIPYAILGSSVVFGTNPSTEMPTVTQYDSLVQIAPDSGQRSFSYTATAHCYIAFLCVLNSLPVSEENAALVNESGLITITLTPA